MSLRTWFRTSRVRRGLAASVIVLSAGGLVLARTPASARTGVSVEATSNGGNSVSFSGPGAHGVISLSQTQLLAGAERRFFLELNLDAETSDQAKERAPISMAVVLDTSGSMDGEKIDQARNAVASLIRDMRDDDEIAFIRYSSDTELVQPLARVGTVRSQLIEKVMALRANGGTNIPPALRMGLAQLGEVGKGRVRRVVLASDGLDNTRAASVEIARTSAEHGVTVSSMGIGLDFDGAYMGGVAQSGRGNFAFVKDAASLTGFLDRELKETAATTIEQATAHVQLPLGVRFVRAIGADAKVMIGNDLQLGMGSLFSNDHRRVVIELATSVDAGEVKNLGGFVTWDRVGGEKVTAKFSDLGVKGTSDARTADESRDGAVFANAMSVLASSRQLDAAEAYDRGDTAKAQAIIEQNVSDLKAAASAAPAAEATALNQQVAEYNKTKGKFAAARPESAEGKAAARKAAEHDVQNLSRKAF